MLSSMSIKIYHFLAIIETVNKIYMAIIFIRIPINRATRQTQKTLILFRIMFTRDRIRIREQKCSGMMRLCICRLRFSM
jgi:hypothetical protein